MVIVKNEGGIFKLARKIVREDQIASNQVQIVGEDGIGEVVSVGEALEEAAYLGLDLVEVGNRDDVSICKYIDYNKHMYNRKKAQEKNESRKVKLKEIKMGCNIEDHDVRVKANNVERILKKGDRVKVIVNFPGRQSHLVFDGEGNALLEDLMSYLEVEYKVYKPISIEGNSVVVILE